MDYVHRLNNVALQRGFHDVDFSADSPQIAHITLLMGECSDAIQLRLITNALGEYATKTGSFRFNVSEPRPVAPKNNFVFLDIVNPTLMFKVKVDLANLTQGLLRTEHHGGPENPPHITIGYFNSGLRSNPFKSIGRADCEGTASNLAVALAGFRGTCNEIVASYPLQISGKADQ